MPHKKRTIRDLREQLSARFPNTHARSTGTHYPDLESDPMARLNSDNDFVTSFRSVSANTLYGRDAVAVRLGMSAAEWRKWVALGMKVVPIGKATGVKVGPKKFASVHDLRRTFADSLAAMEVSPSTIQQLMRHSNLKTTVDHYLPANFDRIFVELDQKTVRGQGTPERQGEPN